MLFIDCPSAGNSILRDTVIEMDKRGEISRNLEDPPLKDTVSVPDGGFTIVRFHADNPGYWLVHCHMSWHNHLGMGFVIKVDKNDNLQNVLKLTIYIILLGWRHCERCAGCSERISHVSRFYRIMCTSFGFTQYAYIALYSSYLYA